MLDGAIANIEKIVRAVGRAFPDAAVICHGYDYTVPNDGKWLGKPMARLGIANKVLQKAIAHEMVDRLNTRLLNLANQSPRVSYVNCRGTVGDRRWHDELHPTDAGYATWRSASRGRSAGLTATRAAPRRCARRALDRRAKLRARRRAKLPTRPEAAKARGISLHIGLNAVDPAQYEGWDGALTACEFDAERHGRAGPRGRLRGQGDAHQAGDAQGGDRRRSRRRRRR